MSSVLACRLAHDVAQNAIRSAAQAIAIISGTNLFMPLIYENRRKDAFVLIIEIAYISGMKKNVLIALVFMAAMSCGRQESESSSAVSFNEVLETRRSIRDFDTLIMGMRDSDALRTLLGIPDGEEVMTVIALGHRASDPVKPTRKPIDEIAKFF